MSVADRLNKLTTDITSAYTSIENKGGTIPANKNTENMSTAIDSIEVIEQATAEGESLNLTNTKAMPYSDYIVKGKSEQETRSGKNKFNYASASDTNNTFLATYRLFEISGLKANSIYNINNISFNSSLSGKYCYIWKTNTYPGGIATILANPNEYYNQKVFETNEEGKVYLAMYPDDTTTWNNIIPYLQYAQIEEGREATSYEPYGASPSPDYPSDINSVADDVNLFDETFRQGNQNSTQVSVRIFSLPSDWLIKNGDVFIFSTNLDTSIYSYAFYIAEKPFMSSNNNFYYNSGYQTTKTFVVNSLYNGYFGFTIRKNDETNINPNDIKQFNFKIQKGTEATPYSPYNQGTVTIKQRGTTESDDFIFQISPLRSLPNGLKDTIEVDGIHRRVGRVVLDGSENGWYQQDNTSYSEDYLRFTIGITDKKNASNPNSKKDNILSNNFTNKILDNNPTRKTNSITGQFSTNLINIFVAQNIINGSRVDDFKTWLSTHNTEILYELAEEITEPLTQNQATIMLDIIKTGSYEGTTNIYTDEDVKPTMEVGYYKKA